MFSGRFVALPLLGVDFATVSHTVELRKSATIADAVSVVVFREKKRISGSLPVFRLFFATNGVPCVVYAHASPGGEFPATVVAYPLLLCQVSMAVVLLQ